ncbi:putative cytoplasmic protein [Fibrella aestuarina BUZ 2]|uniref:Putative cytoplasmic protein n=2 Tax=Fibrella TaxID=861914 RepID=I0K7P1_9BACT|nr:putative cytoplasmic protein [Fibrella aestuarina BUZ 2]
MAHYQLTHTLSIKRMSLTLGELKGINDALINLLKAQGLVDSDTLLEATRTSKGRKELAETIGIDGSVILELANRADLARIKGIGRVYSDLLEEAGVDTVKELAKRVPENLHAKLVEINSVRQLTQRPPSAEQVAGFIEQAKNLPSMLEY